MMEESQGCWYRNRVNTEQKGWKDRGIGILGVGDSMKNKWKKLRIMIMIHIVRLIDENGNLSLGRIWNAVTSGRKGRCSTSNLCLSAQTGRANGDIILHITSPDLAIQKESRIKGWQDLPYDYTWPQTSQRKVCPLSPSPFASSHSFWRWICSG